MNRLLILYGCVLLSSTAIAAIQGSPFEWTPVNEMEQDIALYENKATTSNSSKVLSAFEISTSNNEEEIGFDLDISNIEFLEDEQIDLGFDPEEYLLENFDPHSFYLDLSSVDYLEIEDLALGFETEHYLPKGFDPLKEVVTLSSLHYIEDDTVALGFEPERYLPKDFSPYEPYFDLNSIRYIEIEEESCEDMLLQIQENCTSKEAF